jgi:hypothetical protein
VVQNQKKTILLPKSPRLSIKFKMSSDPVKILAEAEKAKVHKGWFGGNKLDEASELFGQAAVGFKLQKNLQAAAAVIKSF